MNPRDIEIQNRIDALMSAMGEMCAELIVLRAEQEERREGKARERARSGDVPLVFDPDGRTIRWDGGSVRLGKKPYKFVQALYLAKKKRMRIAGIAKAVWGNVLTAPHTINVTFYNLVDELKKENFPYKILNVKKKRKVVEVKNPITGDTRQIAVQPEIIGFMFRIKK